MTKLNSYNSSSPRDIDTSSYRTITWGIVGESSESPHSKRVLSYCIVNPDFYATTDGHNIAFWKPHLIIRTFSLPATALFFFQKISNVVAYVRGSHQLHFISINHPFQIRIHPLHFSESKIFSFYYFKTTSTLVSAGDGILFTRVIIPPYFKDKQPMPETFQFEKISLYYEGIKFKGPNNPRFVENVNFGIVLVNVNDTIHIHTSNGTEVQVISNLFITEHISSLSLLSYSNLYSNVNSNSLVIGTNNGNVSILKFELPDPFVPNAPSESCKNIKTYKITNCPIIMSELFDRNFLVTVDFDRSVTIFGIQNETVIQQFRSSIEAIGGFFAFDRLILFSQFMISIYQCSFFLTHFSDSGSNAVDMFRAVSETRCARIVCTLENSCVSFFSPKDGKRVFGFTTGQGFPNTRNICYVRDVEIDGIQSTKRMCKDCLFCHLDQGITAFLHLDQIDRTNYSNRSDIFRSTISNFNMSWIPSPYIEDHDIINQFVSFIDIGHEQVCGIVETGNAYIFSSSTNKLESSFSLNEKDIICAIYSFSNELLIISAIKKLFTYNLRTRHIVTSSNDCYITSLLLIDSSTLFCGCANGFIEIRNFPSLTVRVNSSFYNTCHTENGHRNPLQDSYLSTRQLYMNPSCVKKLDFCIRREIIMSLSTFGEIFIWDKTGKPLIRVTIPFGAKSACFADGTGSILVSSMETIFKIEWSVLFKKQLLPIQTPLDDFDLRIDSLDMKHVNNREPPVILTVSNEEKFIFYSQNSSDDDQNELNFEDLKVELDQIPKRFFAPLNQDEIDEQPKKTIFPLQDIDEIIENERKQEAERNKKKKEPKEIKVKSRRGDSKRESLFESAPSKSSSARKPPKYSNFYADADSSDSDEPRSSRRYKKKAKKPSKKGQKNNQASSSKTSKATFDRFNAVSKKKTEKKSQKTNFYQPEHSKSMQMFPKDKIKKSMNSDNESYKSANVIKKFESENEIKAKPQKVKSLNKKLENLNATKKSEKKVIKKNKKITKKNSPKKNDSILKKDEDNEKEDDDDDTQFEPVLKISEEPEVIIDIPSSLLTHETKDQIEKEKEESNPTNSTEIDDQSNFSSHQTVSNEQASLIDQKHSEDVHPNFSSHQTVSNEQASLIDQKHSEDVHSNFSSQQQNSDEQASMINSNNSVCSTEIGGQSLNSQDGYGHSISPFDDSSCSLAVNTSFDSSSVHAVHEPSQSRVHEPDSNGSQNRLHSPRNQPLKVKSQSFITQPNDVVSEDLEEEEEFYERKKQSVISSLSDHSRRSSVKNLEEVESEAELGGDEKKTKKVSKFSRISRARPIDDEMFSSFRIDGFDYPFGGYTLKKGRGVVSVGDNAPLLTVYNNKISNGNNKRQKKQKIMKPNST